MIAMRRAAARLACVVPVLLLLTACAHEYVKPPPSEHRIIRVEFADSLSAIDKDMHGGTLHVPNTHVFVTGLQSHSMVAGMFGVVGLLVESAFDAQRSKKTVEGTGTSLDLGLPASINRIGQQLIESDQYATDFTLDDNDNGPVLIISSAVIMSFVNESDARPYVLLKARLRGPLAGSTWHGRYIASKGRPHKFKGLDSWTEDDARQLRPVVAEDLRRALTVLLNDVATPYPRNENHQVTVQSWFPDIEGRAQMVGFGVGAEGGYLLFLPRRSDNFVYQGINILDESVTRHHPAREDDDDFELLD
ncbi:MAG: hypothetical protein WCD36_14505 [Rhodanobacteraceae bacterium]